MMRRFVVGVLLCAAAVLSVAGARPSGTELLAQESDGGSPFRFVDVGRAAGLLPAAENFRSHGAAWGDVDGDGWPELYVATFHYAGTQPNLLFRNRQGELIPEEDSTLRISTRATGVVFADFDNDGDLDLYVASMPGAEGSKLATRHGHAMRGCSLFENNGNGNFSDVSRGNEACPARFGGRSACVLDFDGDGRLDLLVGEDPLAGYNGSPTSSSRLFRNVGDLQFEDASRDAGLPEVPGFGVAAGDVNVDGWTDIFIASTLGNHLLLNDGAGKFEAAPQSEQVFAWPTAEGDDMVCGVTIGDVNRDRLPDIVIGQHFSHPWTDPIPNRLYLNRGVTGGVPRYEDVTEQAGLIGLPMKAPHVEVQDFNNDGWSDLYTSIVLFEGDVPHPVIFENLGGAEGDVPQFRQYALGVNDFPTPSDRGIRRSRTFFEKMLAERKIFYSAPGPSCDFDRDGDLDLFLGSWWAEAPSLLLENASPTGNWIDVEVHGAGQVNRMGIGARVDVYRAGTAGDTASLLGSREVGVGSGYASASEAVAHFGLGTAEACDLVVTFPRGSGTAIERHVPVNRRHKVVMTAR